MQRRVCPSRPMWCSVQHATTAVYLLQLLLTNRCYCLSLARSASYAATGVTDRDSIHCVLIRPVQSVQVHAVEMSTPMARYCEVL